MSKFEAADSRPSRIDLTPMLDVVFIMLIFFIVTAVFVREEGIDLPTSDRPIQSVSTSEAILIDVVSASRVIISGDAIDVRSVRPVVERIYAQEPDKSVVIRPHPESDTNTLVLVLDAVRAAGVSNLALAEI
ncbi:MAG: biopolymer transporter ExbD [Pseudomonadota bacterium]